MEVGSLGNAFVTGYMTGKAAAQLQKLCVCFF